MGTSISVNPFGKIKLFEKEKVSKLCFAGKWTESYHSQQRFTEDELGREFTLSKWRFQSLPCVTAIMKRRTQNANKRGLGHDEATTEAAATQQHQHETDGSNSSSMTTTETTTKMNNDNGDDHNHKPKRTEKRTEKRTREEGERERGDVEAKIRGRKKGQMVLKNMFHLKNAAASRKGVCYNSKEKNSKRLHAA